MERFKSNNPAASYSKTTFLITVHVWAVCHWIPVGFAGNYTTELFEQDIPRATAD